MDSFRDFFPCGRMSLNSNNCFLCCEEVCNFMKSCFQIQRVLVWALGVLSGRRLTASVVCTAVFHAPLQSQLQVTSWIHCALIFTQAFQLYFCCCDKKKKKPEKSQSSGEGVAFTLQFHVIVLGGAVKVAASGDSWSGHMTSAV